MESSTFLNLYSRLVTATPELSLCSSTCGGWTSSLSGIADPRTGTQLRTYVTQRKNINNKGNNQNLRLTWSLFLLFQRYRSRWYLCNRKVINIYIDKDTSTEYRRTKTLRTARQSCVPDRFSTASFVRSFKTRKHDINCCRDTPGIYRTTQQTRLQSLKT